MTNETESLLKTWFGENLDSPDALGARIGAWFAPEASFDDQLRQDFGTLPDRALREDPATWDGSARATLARVIALDQLPRNLYRGTAQAFAYDAKALAVATSAIDRDLDAELHPAEAAFYYYPFEHAEDAAAQAKSVALFQALAERAPKTIRAPFDTFIGFAERHRAVIEKFGRFPHRNEVLDRQSTPEEIRYLAEGGETFTSGDSDRDEGSDD